VEGDGALLNWVSWFNIDDFPGAVIVARDLGQENERLMRAFPGHHPIRVALSGRAIRLQQVQ
jgi:hypothetical protein